MDSNSPIIQELLRPENFTYINDKIFGLIESAFQGSMESLIIVLGILIISLIFLMGLYRLSKSLFGLIKRLFIVVIIIGFVAAFFISFYDKIFVPNPDPVYIIVGISGIICAIIVLLISLAALKTRAKTAFARQQIISVKDELREKLIKEAKEETMHQREYTLSAPREISPTQAQQPKMLTQSALTTNNLFSSVRDKSILSVIAFIVVAEFGVFSSVTIAAPTVMAGAALFVAFMFAAFIFIKSSYHSYKTGVSHLFIGTIIALALSLVLGATWGNPPLPIETLLSIEYFKTSSLVATVTGLAVSLFMGSKE
ncbi:MAG: hypothetical protein WC308_04555 [archaeon]|jgi:MFS family permease